MKPKARAGGLVVGYVLSSCMLGCLAGGVRTGDDDPRATCDPGFVWSGDTCADVDECATASHHCDAHAACENVPGAHACTCLPGFLGDGRTCMSNQYLREEELTAPLRQQLDGWVLAAAPPGTRPRLYGVDAVWGPTVDAFVHFDPQCVRGGVLNGIGTVKHMGRVWDHLALGGARCDGRASPTLAAHPDFARYATYDGTYDSEAGAEAGQLTYDTSRQRALYLVRWLRYCHRTTDGAGCIYSASEVDPIVPKLIAYEMDRLRSFTPNGCGFYTRWHQTSSLFFDIGADRGFSFWNLWLDLLWDEIAEADRNFVSDALEREIDSYLCSYEGVHSEYCAGAFDPPCNRPLWPEHDLTRPAGFEQCHWSLCNFNNWTPVLNASALLWAINFYHEKPRKARAVLAAVLTTNWEHRPYVLSDGGYREGSVYVGLSYKNSRKMNRLLRTSFGHPLNSYKWGRMPETARWVLDNMMPDGHIADFGDARGDRTGFDDMMILEQMLYEELIGVEPVGSVTMDPCLVKELFTNLYHGGVEQDLWTLEPSLARDWMQLVDSCEQIPATRGAYYPEYRMAVLRSAVTAGVALAGTKRAIYGEADLLYAQANHTSLAITAADAAWPHRELDFGGVIWTVHGNRLLADFGYGAIFHRKSDAYYYEGQNHSDYMLGANILVLPGAAEGVEYRAQLRDAPGTLERVHIDGGVAYFADGSAPYGAGRSDGFVDFFGRWIIPLEDGNFLLVDAFAAVPDKADRAQEFWYAPDDVEIACTGNSQTSTDVVVSVPAPYELVLQPRCSDLDERAAEGQGRLLAAARQPGAFVRGFPDFLLDNVEFAANAIDGYVTFGADRTAWRRELVRWTPDDPITEDVRAFLLQRGVQGRPFAAASVTYSACGVGKDCFDIIVDGVTSRRVIVAADLSGYFLERLDAPIP